MKVYYCDQFVLPLPVGHRFPISKYRLLYERVAQSNSGQFELRVPDAAVDEDLLLAHDREYVWSVTNGALSDREIRELGFPWSLELVERSRRSNGATIAACHAALDEGVAVNLAGGTHHAHRDRGQGYCVFNDSVVAGRVMQREKLVRRVLVLDCDVHQGNGTATIVANDPTIFTFSIHGQKNFPVNKACSDLDIELPDGTDDDTYLEVLESGVVAAIVRAKPELVIFIAGADPYKGDRLGRLALSKQGLAARDELIFGYCDRYGLPVALTMGGGYAPDVQDTVDIHFQSVTRAAAYAEHGSLGSVA